MNVFFWILIAPLAVFVTVFAVANRAPVTVDLWPFPFAIETPIFLLVLLCGLVGFLIGTFAAWVAGSKSRSRARLKAAEAAAQAREAERLKERVRELEASSPASSQAARLGPPRDFA